MILNKPPGFLHITLERNMPVSSEFHFTAVFLTADYKKFRAYTLEETVDPESLLNNFQYILLPIIIC